ncbi:hypothetical protein D7X87_25390 [bacterium D16-54]|jgi:hypothetical protein|nr:hypothetical protein D7X87_25390 [bacterium D16-54]RKJ10558.1 hypothetical protein D7X65_23080 [bacterium D16-56]
MNNLEYNKWLKEKIDELANTNIKCNGNYNEDLIREYLIFSSYVGIGEELLNFFKQNINDENLLKVLFKILLDESEEYSNDARYSAARMIPLFNSDILKKYKKELHHAQSYKINNLKPFPKDEPIWLSECKW